MTVYHTFEELNKWLSQNGNFEDAYILQTESNPLSITVGIEIHGNYKAYSARHLRPFTITSKNVISTSPFSIIDGFTDVLIENIEAIETSEGVGIRICICPYFDIIAKSFIIEEQEVIKTTLKPSVRHDLTAQYPTKRVPTPNFWIEKLKEEGIDVCFRYYAGTQLDPQKLPELYSGYFLQFTDCIAKTEMGIFFEWISWAKGQVLLAVSVREERSEDEQYVERIKSLWMLIARMLFEQPNVKISCGNCQFTGNEWQFFNDLFTNDPSKVPQPFLRQVKRFIHKIHCYCKKI